MQQEVFRMNPEDARIAGRQESPSMAGMVPEEKERCMMPFAQSAARRLRFLLSHVWINQFIAVSVFQTAD